MIPKRIFYAWFGGNPKPKNVLKNIRSWSEYNPEFEIVEINESNFDIGFSDFTKQAYSDKKWAFVSDVARVFFVYSYGGFYLDTDVELVRSLNFLANLDAFWAMENSNSVNSGLAFGARKGNSILREILSQYKINTFHNEPVYKIMTVPIVTNILRRHGFKSKNRKQVLDDGAVVFPTYMFAPLHFWGGGRVKRSTVSIHHYSASWVNGDAKSGASRMQLIKWKTTFYVPWLVEFIDRLRGRH